MKCKLSGDTTCSFFERLKREPKEQDCFLCFAICFRGFVEEFSSIILEVGAGPRTKHFRAAFLAFDAYDARFMDFVEKCYPEMLKSIKEAVVIAPYGVPKEIEDALRKFLDRKKEGVV